MTTITKHPTVTAKAGPGPRLQYLTNLVENPRAALSLTGYTAAAGTGGAGALEAVTGGGPLPASRSLVRLRWGTAPSSANSQLYYGKAGLDLLPVTPGKRYTFSVYVRANWAATVSALIGLYNGSTYVTSTGGTVTTLTPNKWTQLTVSIQVPAGVTRAQLNVNPHSSSILPAAGSTLDASALMLYETPAGSTDAAAYGDGDAPGWTWAGTPHASSSTGYGAITDS